MDFIADLHIHSRFSRATAKTLDFPNLYIAAREKGIHVVGTGDCTHPAWFEEIQEHLVAAEPGLFKLHDDLEKKCEESVQVGEAFPVRFLLSCEISSIYKKNGITRKTHNLILLPDLTEAARLNSRLEQIGNIRSDGRPILGLDTRDLLEILLETSETGFLIPAHIWTPWFSMFGSKSGFDRIEECFEDLTPYVFAVETGLSSDPPMNWRVGNIDGLTLVSNSDAHSPANLGREANIFKTELSFPAIRKALETGDPEAFGGTLEFFPQEGKYHQDGHRKCGVNLHPREAIQRNGICPVCGHPLTLGVLHRVEELATRPEGEKPEQTHPYYSLIPLAEILSEIVGTGPKSKKVQNACHRVQRRIGPELSVLHTLPLEALDAAGIPLLAEAVRRMRSEEVSITPGFDGQYGEIKVFAPQERDRLIGQQNLFAAAGAGGSRDCGEKGQAAPLEDAAEDSAKTASSGENRQAPDSCRSLPGKQPAPDLLDGLNADQKRAVQYGWGPLLIAAGPGTGKTRTLTCRIAHLLRTQTARPEQILALTFTNKAAAEMSERIAACLGDACEQPWTGTFHSFCHRFLKEAGPGGDFTIIDDEERKRLVRESLLRTKARKTFSRLRADAAADRIIAAKQQILGPSDDLSAVSGELGGELLGAIYEAYQQLLAGQRLCDYEDLIFQTVNILEADAAVRQRVQERYTHIFVDEYQDLNYGQYRIIRALTRPGGSICVIGDPDQSIYGFRGSDAAFFGRFTEDFPAAARIRLVQNYRSTETILEAAHHVIRNHGGSREKERVRSGISGPETLRLLSAPTEAAEAVMIGKSIETLIGGTGFSFDDFGGNLPGRSEPYHAFSDFAVLFRTRSQGDILAETLGRAGIPFQRASKQSLWRRKGIEETLSCLKLLEGCGTYADLELCLKTLAPDLEPQDIRALLEWGESRRLPAGGLMAEAERMPVTGISPAMQAALPSFLNRIARFSRDLAGRGVSDKLYRLGRQQEFAALCGSDENSREAWGRVLAHAAAFGEDSTGFIQSAALQDDPDAFDQKSEKVALLTLHAAKGLEFPVVFIAGCEAGLLPLALGGGEPADPDEERRLFYVGMTRAMQLLFFTRARNRRLYGKNEKRAPSPFLSDIEPKLLTEEKAAAKTRRAGQQQLNLF
jgi:uncharacterized protein (TIGR00375 family)